MPKILAGLAFVLGLLVSQSALACRSNERKVGPVCVLQGKIKTGSFYRIISKVTFDADPFEMVVWEDLGYVERATKKELVVIEPRLVDGKGMMDVEVTYIWDGKKFKFVPKP